MLLHAALALEGARDDVGGVVVAVAAQILDAHLRVRQPVLDQPLDRRRIHRHGTPPVENPLRGCHIGGPPRFIDPPQLCRGYGIGAFDCPRIPRRRAKPPPPAAPRPQPPRHPPRIPPCQPGTTLIPAEPQTRGR